MAAPNVEAASKDLWSEYFHSIRSQCPWSWAAWRKHQIDIQPWRGQLIDLDPSIQARVYVCKKLNARQLKKLCNRLDQSEVYEWLWSHPKYGQGSTPWPCLIQQDRQQLAQIRRTLNART